MPTTNSRKSATFTGEQHLTFERDSKVGYTDSGKDRDDTSATVSFTPMSDSGIEIGFSYVSYQAEKIFGRELSLNLSQVIELKRFLDEHLEHVLLKNKHVFIFLYGEQLKDEFASENFINYEFICLARIPDKKLAKYRGKDHPDIVGLSFSKDNWVFGKIYKISLYDKQNLDSKLNIGHLLLNGSYGYPRKINSDEYVKLNDESVSVIYYKLNDVSPYFRGNHRDLLPDERQLLIELYKENGFSEPYIVELMGKV